MRQGYLFWGSIIILLGVLFLLQALGLAGDVFGWFWPLVIIFLGLWMMLGRFLPRPAVDAERFGIDLQGAKRVDVHIGMGAGSLNLCGGAPAGLALGGNMGAGLDYESNLQDDALAVEIKAGPTIFPFLGPESGTWNVLLASGVPVSVHVEAGASTLELDCSALQLSFLGVNAGASSIHLKLPGGEGHSLVDIQSGAAHVDVEIPAGVGARIRMGQGASSVQVDEQRFLRVAGQAGLYQSAGYESNPRQVELNLEGGANTVLVHG